MCPIHHRNACALYNTSVQAIPAAWYHRAVTRINVVAFVRAVQTKVACRERRTGKHTNCGQANVTSEVCLFVCPSVCPSLCVSVSLSLSLSLSVCLSVGPSIRPSAWLSVCLPLCLSLSLSMAVSLSLLVCSNTTTNTVLSQRKPDRAQLPKKLNFSVGFNLPPPPSLSIGVCPLSIGVCACARALVHCGPSD